MPKHYNHFVSRQNRMNKPFNLPLFPEDIRELNEKQFEEIKEHIACEISPENLHCDGEASQAQVEETLEHLHMLCREINANTPYSFEISELDY